MVTTTLGIEEDEQAHALSHVAGKSLYAVYFLQVPFLVFPHYTHMQDVHLQLHGFTLTLPTMLFIQYIAPQA